VPLALQALSSNLEASTSPAGLPLGLKASTTPPGTDAELGACKEEPDGKTLCTAPQLGEHPPPPSPVLFSAPLGSGRACLKQSLRERLLPCSPFQLYLSPLLLYLAPLLVSCSAAPRFRIRVLLHPKDLASSACRHIPGKVLVLALVLVLMLVLVLVCAPASVNLSSRASSQNPRPSLVLTFSCTLAGVSTLAGVCTPDCECVP